MAIPETHVILARRSGDIWYVAGIHQAETDQTYEMQLNFLPEGAYTLSLLEDQDDELVFREETVKGGQAFSVTLAPYGGFVGTLRAQ